MTRTTIRELVDAGYLDEGEKLTGRYQGRELTATVRADGKLRVGRRVYPSPSKAARAAQQRVNPAAAPVNGWAFWHAPGGQPISDLRDRLAAERGEASPRRVA